MYDLYKPLRNYLRQFSQVESLHVAYCYFQYLQFAVDLPDGLGRPGFGRKLDDRMGLFEWELEVLVREIILNCPPRGAKTLMDWSSFAQAINHVKRIENDVWGRLPDSEDHILWEMHRIAHRQFPWQRKPNHPTVARYFRIFNHPQMSALTEEVMGLSPSLLYRVGLGLSGHFLKKFTALEPFDLRKLDVSPEGAKSVFDAIAVDHGSLPSLVREQQSYDVNWAYVFNPLRKFPVVRMPLGSRSALLCPIPTFLVNRITDGVYYELAHHKKFANAFGRAFESYVGEVLSAANKDGRLSLIPEHFYGAKSARKATTDWIVSDGSGTMFLECKTKRLLLEAKVELKSRETLLAELDKMAGFVAQLYKTVNDAVSGKYEKWKPNGKPIFPIVVTLDNWHMFGFIVQERIDGAVRSKLSDMGLDPALIDRHPYSICAVEDLEIGIQVIAQRSIAEVLEPRLTGEHRSWVLDSFLRSEFRAEMDAAKFLFPEVWGEIHPAFA